MKLKKGVTLKKGVSLKQQMPKITPKKYPKAKTKIA